MFGREPLATSNPETAGCPRPPVPDGLAGPRRGCKDLPLPDDPTDGTPPCIQVRPSTRRNPARGRSVTISTCTDWPSTRRTMKAMSKAAQE